MSHSIDEDAIFLIAVQCRTRSLKRLASVSRRFRLICMPLLFSTCRVKHRPRAKGHIPPPGLRPYIRHLTYEWVPAPSTFRQHLKHSPRLCAITFQGSWAGVPFALIELCLRHPRIVSITFPEDSDWSSLIYYTAVPPPQDSYPNSLERLFYTSYPWKTTRARLTDRDRLKEHTVEAGHLGPLVLGMHSTAESLSFPVDVAPLAHMVELSWPRLRDLTLTGRFSDASQVSYMSRLVGFMSCPRSLSIQVAQLADHPRPRVLQKHQLRSMDMHGLQSLTLAYPSRRCHLHTCRAILEALVSPRLASLLYENSVGLSLRAGRPSHAGSIFVRVLAHIGSHVDAAPAAP
ncbi:hypothetical protein OH76DRAFT_345843 [Lentinus brumalis]|uniref:F-box domain-containing protein n=1 Tax=Lentinus brumalis TaxID=2498619 RepID=A0A371DEW3_9APHY|nr:hypothetical protein OH76DRAFT_345843 [Polyporus brumalis]